MSKASRPKKSTPDPGPVTTKLRKVEIDALLSVAREAKPPGSGLRPALSGADVDRYERGERCDTVSAPPGDDQDA